MNSRPAKANTRSEQTRLALRTAREKRDTAKARLQRLLQITAPVIDAALPNPLERARARTDLPQSETEFHTASARLLEAERDHVAAKGRPYMTRRRP